MNRAKESSFSKIPAGKRGRKEPSSLGGAFGKSVLYLLLDGERKLHPPQSGSSSLRRTEINRRGEAPFSLSQDPKKERRHLGVLSGGERTLSYHLREGGGLIEKGGGFPFS